MEANAKNHDDRVAQLQRVASELTSTVTTLRQELSSKGTEMQHTKAHYERAADTLKETINSLREYRAKSVREHACDMNACNVELVRKDNRLCA